MKVNSRTNHKHTPIRDLAIINRQGQQQHICNLDQNSLQISERYVQYQIGEMRKLHVNVQAQANHAKSINNKSTTTNLDSKNANQSVQYPITHSDLKDWKILTLRQLRKKVDLEVKRQVSERRKKSQGISVSLSQQKTSSKSIEKRKQEDVLKGISTQRVPYFKYLSSLNKKGLLDRLQCLEKKQHTFLC